VPSPDESQEAYRVKQLRGEEAAALDRMSAAKFTGRRDEAEQLRDELSRIRDQLEVAQAKLKRKMA